MEWYWYVLIGVGVIAIGVLKNMAWKQMLRKRKEKAEQKPHEED